MPRIASSLPLLAALLFAMPATGLANAVSEKPRLGILLNEKKPHQDEFNRAMKTLGWDPVSYTSKPENFKELIQKLGDYDLLVAAPLFWPKADTLDETEKEAVRKFLREGGMLAITDGSYEVARDWLIAIDPTFDGLTTGKCNSSQWAVNGATYDSTPAHPVRFFPSRITEPNSWPHFEMPAEGSKWVEIARCSEGKPVTFVQKYGKGMVVISALRQATEKQMENLYANMLLNRAGIEIADFNLPEPEMGGGTLKLVLGKDAEPGSSLVYEITPEGGAPERFEKAIAGKSLELPYRFTHRGPTTCRLVFKTGGKEILLFSRKAVLPQLITAKPNAYRGILSTVRRLPNVKFPVELAPDREQLKGQTVRLEVLNADGKAVGNASRKLDKDGKQSFYESIDLDRSLPAGTYTVKAVLTDGSKAIANSEATFKILEPQEGQTIIDEDLTFLVNGKPFFARGIYHVKPEDYPTVAGLGLNTVQYWAWHRAEGLESAANHGLKAVYELNHKSEKIIRDTVAKFGGAKNVLMWYGMDEPAEGSYSTAEMLRNTYNVEDDQRPVFMVSCRPDVFKSQSQFSNVFGVDPYGAPKKVKDWIGKAVKDMDGHKAVIAVPGSFGKEGLPEFRASAYICLASDARGIIWYPWSQAGGGPIGVGLKTKPEQQAVMKELCGEIERLEGALTSTVRVPFRSEDDKLLGIYTTDGKTQTVILVNSTDQPIQGEAVIAAAKPVNGKFTDIFKSEKESLNVSESQVKISLAPYETRAFELK